MKIVVLDGHTLNPGDLSWSPLEALGNCDIYPRTSANEVKLRSEPAELILTNKVPLSADLITSLPRLRYIGVTATGYNIVDVTAARKRAIPVSNVPAYGTRSVAQLTFALLLELAHHAGDHSASVHQGDWSRQDDWCYWRTPLVELDGLTLGLVGFGRIGQAVAQLGLAFGMNIQVHTRTPPAEWPPGVQPANLDHLFAECDVVSLHCPLTPDTEKIVNRARLERMKPTAFLLNTSRLIDEPALRDALESGRIAGAGLDVLSVEPPPPNHPLVSAPRCVVTPHLAWATQAARRRLLSVSVENVRAFLTGSPQNVVNARPTT